jgi:hypothetical protein
VTSNGLYCVIFPEDFTLFHKHRCENLKSYAGLNKSAVMEVGTLYVLKVIVSRIKIVAVG